MMEFVKDSIFNSKFPCESDVVDIKNYFENYAKKLIPFEACQSDSCRSNAGFSCEELTCKNDEFFINFLNISKEQLNELKERTDPSHLTCDGEVKPVSREIYKKFSEARMKRKSTPKETEVSEPSLFSLKRRTEILTLPDVEFPRQFLKYSNYQWYPNNEKPVKTSICFQPEVFSNIVACVRVYHPFLSDPNKNTRLKLLQEIHILGDQKLCELKDKITCSLDHIGDNDLSTECFLKEVGVNITAKDEYPSSFIFIGNTFYNDTRTPELIDLSRVIREWATVKGLGQFDCQSMEKTKICDLKLKIGRPYVYQHQGNCEHLIVFSDIRFLELREPAKPDAYPRYHCTARTYGKNCMMCAKSYARWIVIGSDRLTHDKTFLCKKCFFSYNYINGQKVGEFEAYKYMDPIALL